jgi:hypothetical protein
VQFVNGMTQQRADVFDGTIRAVRPESATLRGDTLVPAAEVLLEVDASPWITNNGENYTLHVDVTERPAAR